MQAARWQVGSRKGVWAATAPRRVVHQCFRVIAARATDVKHAAWQCASDLRKALQHLLVSAPTGINCSDTGHTSDVELDNGS